VTDQAVARGNQALDQGRWVVARTAFEEALTRTDSAEAWRGLASALWWLGETADGVASARRAYALLRRSGRSGEAVQCAVWLAITYKSNYGNVPVANGWLARAERLLSGTEPGVLHGWLAIARAYRLPDLKTAENLTHCALQLARTAADVDLELVALSQLGLVAVESGRVAEGFALLDEATAGALAGEGASLDTVVYTCCDLLTACEAAEDVERAVHWCSVADDFVARYGCPFLYAECRLAYGSVLAAAGRWSAAAEELELGIRFAASCPALRARAQVRLASLRIGQGRLEEAEELLKLADLPARDSEAALGYVALALSRGDHGQAWTFLEGWRPTTGAAGRVQAAAAEVRGRQALARGETEAAARHLAAAFEGWSAANCRYEAARARTSLGQAVAGTDRDMAIRHLGGSLATLEALGASLDADRAAAALRALGVATRSPRPGADGLTGREREVLQLLGQGLSNPEIAERLFISRKTAAHHVSHVLAKLGVANRTAAAAYAVRHADS
jgi:DNA-binding CsgD family transcriptional regulator